MPFKVEDGSGFVDSNSYGAVADADAYFVLRGNGEWAALTTDQKQVALVKATDYIDQRFGGRFVGDPMTDEQALAWPRDNTGRNEWDESIIPTKLQYACFEYADRARLAPLAPDLVYGTSGVATIQTKEKVGPIERTFAAVGGDSASQTLLRPYPAADMYLRGLVYSTGGVYR